MPKITISYRRKDSDAMTGRIRDRMAAYFGEKSIFMDIDSIPLGIDFRKQIQEALRENQVLLAVIGPHWTGPVEGGPARILDPADPVRIEVETALASGIPTIPVLVGGATLPKASELPESLKELPFFNAAEVSAGLDFNTHVDRLIRAVEHIIKAKSPTALKVPAALARSKWLVVAGGALACVAIVAAALVYHYRPQATAPSVEVQKAQAPPQPSVPPTASQTAQMPPQPVTSAPQTQSPPVAPPDKNSADARAAAAACDPGSVPVFYDNFKTIDPAWYKLGTDPHSDYYVADNQLIVAARADEFVANYRQATFRNGSICTQLISPPTMKNLSDTSAGLMFWGIDDEHFYDAIIFPDGTYKIEKWVKDSSTELGADKTDAIKTGPLAKNTIKITNTNDTNTLYINGRKIKEFKGQAGKDENYLGMIANSEPNQVDEWRFGEIVMTQPNYADEFTDFGVSPQSTLKDNVGANTPTSIPGAKTISTTELYAAIQRGTLDGSPFVMADVLLDAHPKTIRGAKRLADKSAYTGSFDDDVQQSLRKQLTALTKNSLAMPIVFFCEGAKCWESYNAALRAEKMGFTRVYWYRGGINTWKAAGLPMN
jgi:PQQ-dependent catabolism-associated CXXCW motif protein